MANTVNILSHANTFSEWLIATNALIKENNDFAQNNFVKTANTLFLNGQAIGLSVANNATVGGQLTVYSSTVQNILQVSGESAFTNANASITTTGRVNVGGSLFANSIFVANTSNFSGPIIVANTINATGNVTLTNHLYVTSNAVFSSNVDVRNGTINSRNIRNELNTNTASLTVTGAGTIGTNLTVGGQLSVGGQLTATGNFIISGNTSYDAASFTLGASNVTANNGSILVNRGTTGANAAFRWNEPIKSWDVLDVANSTYSKIVVEGNTYANPSWIGSLAYSKLTGAPTNVSSFTNDAGYITTAATTANSNVALFAVTANTLNSAANYTCTNFTSTGRIFLANGSATAPSLAFSSDSSTDTGLYWTTDGSINFTNNGVYSGIIAAGGHLTMVGNITAYSDERLKVNVKTIENALDKTCQLRGVTFERDGQAGLGVIAQETQKVLPEVVLQGNDADRTLSVAYGNIVGVLIEAIKELKAEVDELKKNQK